MNDNVFNSIKDSLVRMSTRRWDWSKIDCCFTGKDADLEPSGKQGCQLVSVDDTKATVTLYAGKTFVGDDVCLNLPKDATEADYDACHKIYMEQATEVVCGCGSNGEWDGDSWWMTYEDTFTVPLAKGHDGRVIVEASAKAIFDACWDHDGLDGWEKEIKLADDMLNCLSGWETNHMRGKHCKEGKPGKESVWRMYKESKKG